MIFGEREGCAFDQVVDIDVRGYPAYALNVFRPKSVGNLTFPIEVGSHPLSPSILRCLEIL